MQQKQLCIRGQDEAVDGKIVKLIDLAQVHVVSLPLHRVDWVKGSVHDQLEYVLLFQGSLLAD